MSYSAWGIREKELKHSFYNCSWSGLDLYYNYCMYRYIEEHPCFLNIDTVLLVFPYYYFDYDMSRSFGQYESGQIFSIRRLDDWHHSDQVPGAYDYIANYRMFGEKITRFYHMPKWKGESPYTLKEPDGGILLDPLWFADHGETVEENQEIFVQFYKSIESRRGTPAIVIPPFYLEGLNLVSKTAFQAKKEKFYGILREQERLLGKIRVFDYADAFTGRRDLFREVTHLNSKGAEAFTELINRDVLGWIESK